MDEKEIIIDLVNRVTVISKPLLFVDWFGVRLVIIPTRLSSIPNVFLKSPPDIVEHVNMLY